MARRFSNYLTLSCLAIATAFGQSGGSLLGDRQQLQTASAEAAAIGLIPEQRPASCPYIIVDEQSTLAKWLAVSQNTINKIREAVESRFGLIRNEGYAWERERQKLLILNRDDRNANRIAEVQAIIESLRRRINDSAEINGLAQSFLNETQRAKLVSLTDPNLWSPGSASAQYRLLKGLRWSHPGLCDGEVLGN